MTTRHGAAAPPPLSVIAALAAASSWAARRARATRLGAATSRPGRGQGDPLPRRSGAGSSRSGHGRRPTTRATRPRPAGPGRRRPRTDTQPGPRPPPTARHPATPSRPPTPPRPRPRARVAVDVDIVTNHEKVFAHELKETWCASAGVQMALAIQGKADTSNAFQRELQSRVHEWESYKDSHNGTGVRRRWRSPSRPTARRATRSVATRLAEGALRDAAKAIQRPVAGHPAGLARCPYLGHDRLPADADPSVFQTARSRARTSSTRGTRNSSIWGQSDPPGTFQNTVGDGPELPAVEAARGQLPGPRRPVHRGRPDASSTPAELTPIRRTRVARKNASSMSLAIMPAA